MILDHKLQRMLNDSKIAQLNSERPLHQTAVITHSGKKSDRKIFLPVTPCDRPPIVREQLWANLLVLRSTPDTPSVTEY